MTRDGRVALASTRRMVDAGGTPVKIYPAPTGEPQNALPLPLLLRDFIFKNDPDPVGIPRDFTAPAPVQHSSSDTSCDVSVSELSLMFHSAPNTSLWRRAFPSNHLHCYRPQSTKTNTHKTPTLTARDETDAS